MVSAIWSYVLFMAGVIAFVFLVGVAGILVKEVIKELRR